jgi:hypothetical protein
VKRRASERTLQGVIFGRNPRAFASGVNFLCRFVVSGGDFWMSELRELAEVDTSCTVRSVSGL